MMSGEAENKAMQEHYAQQDKRIAKFLAMVRANPKEHMDRLEALETETKWAMKIAIAYRDETDAVTSKKVADRVGVNVWDLNAVLNYWMQEADK